MNEFLERINFQNVKFTGQMAVACAVIWLLIVGCAISSVRSQPFTRAQRWFWIIVIIGLPAIGLLAYLPFSFSREDLPHAFLLKQRKGRKRGPSRTYTSQKGTGL